MAIPVIDLKDFPEQSGALLRACEEWGCFRIVNHKIPSVLLSDMKSVIKSLFDLPMEIKRRNTDVIVGSGYWPPSKENPFYEAFGLFDVASPQAVETFCTNLDASPQQRETILLYSRAISDLGMEIGRKIAGGMGLDCDFMKEWPCQFRINRYNFTPDTVGSSGVCMHTDSGFLTILQDDENVGGLEVMDKTGAFVIVEPMPGTLLANLGDMSTLWSNGRFYNVKHRVQCKEAMTRFSIAMFVLGPKEEALEAPPEFVDAEHPRLYSPITFEDFRKLRLSIGARAGEALEHVRLQPAGP
ncbi:hypothetical protein NE237_016592 [Protea cynaroides]|uniref:2-oxoglutarate-dependent dioxygenase DAO n=1 Tax=Protea cynaroides TaxID=273540 RepID=A0A9Q0K727_9MAGN|nr:hypothetical protein NE237_016592 [Protea cynaroides]